MLGVARAEKPTVFLLGLLKELWNYWLWVLAVETLLISTAGLSRVERRPAGSGRGLVRWRAVGS